MTYGEPGCHVAYNGEPKRSFWSRISPLSFAALMILVVVLAFEAGVSYGWYQADQFIGEVARGLQVKPRTPPPIVEEQ